MEKIKWQEKINHEVLEYIAQKRTPLNSIVRRKKIGLVIFKEEIAFFMMSFRTDEGSKRSRKKKNTTPL